MAKNKKRNSCPCNDAANGTPDDKPLVQLADASTPKLSIIAAYYQNWSQYRLSFGGKAPLLPKMINPNLITDLYYAFATFGPDSMVRATDKNDPEFYSQMQALKTANPSLRTILSIIGWQPGDHLTRAPFSQMIADPASRATFIQSAIAYAKENKFDGIDIYWQSPGDLTQGGSVDDFKNFPRFLQDFYTVCKKETPALLLTYNSPKGIPSGVPTAYKNFIQYFGWLATCAPYLDRFNVMAYDYHTPFDGSTTTGTFAPYKAETAADMENIANTLNTYYKAVGISSNKIMLGIALYGRSYGGVMGLQSDHNPGHPFTKPGQPGPYTQLPGLLSVGEIAQGGFQVDQDALNYTAVAWNSNTGEWVSYDNPATIAQKANYVAAESYGGVVFWGIDFDDYANGFPNITAARI